MKVTKFIILLISITLLFSFTLTLNSSVTSSVSVVQTNKIYLAWKNSEDAVAYEMEITTKPYKPSDSVPAEEIIYHTVGIFTPGIELDLNPLPIQHIDKTYYRVRPLDLDRKPLATFSEPMPLSSGQLNPTKPQPTALFNTNRPVPLYPTYSWIPVLGAEHYVVEVTKGVPENPNGVTPSKKQIYSYTVDEGFDCYDTHAYVDEGTYYWRVIALNKDDSPIGTYSDAIPFHISIKHYTWAVFGDSITHGGGAISNSPSDIRFDYSSYLPYEIKNLGRSGDSVESLVERFNSDVLPFHPKYLFILESGNSIRGGTKAEDVIKQFQRLINKCKQNDITPIFLTIPPINPDRIERVFHKPSVEDWQSQTAIVNTFLKEQQYVIDVNPLLSDNRGFLPTMYSQDGLHPDISGKKVIADAVIRFLLTFDNPSVVSY
ncbi:SGNH/GDSL hydrolase family protein [Pelosinus sp. sgz500959]|uniref:SGNH/GDSL hydrolase family protein n=1 Tax=Pelosinus sp. sgz500959 TaxID=3242472 RepID=UPI00366D0D79